MAVNLFPLLLEKQENASPAWKFPSRHCWETKRWKAAIKIVETDGI